VPVPSGLPRSLGTPRASTRGRAAYRLPRPGASSFRVETADDEDLDRAFRDSSHDATARGYVPVNVALVVRDQIIAETKSALTQTNQQPLRTLAKSSGAWKPQPCGLTREELRKIVLDALG
jgi:hypothetical protein